MIVLAMIFWGSLALIALGYVVFPLIILARPWLVRRPIRQGDCGLTLSVIVAAHNEQESIRQKLNNLLSQDFPAHRREIIVASDGSTDETDAIVSEFSPDVTLLSLPRRGKIPTMNSAAAAAQGDVLVFTDANCLFPPATLQELLSPFADPEVGGVAGNQVYLRDSAEGFTSVGECAYWDFDRRMKMAQSLAGNVTSATGSLYAMRRELFRPIPAGVTDDFVASTQVIAEGKRLVFAPRAIAFEPVAVSTPVEFGRKVRVLTQGFLAVWVRRELMNPRRFGFYSLQLFWHKVLRRLMVLPLLALAISSLLLMSAGPLYQWAAIGQGVFYLLALLGAVLGGSRLLPGKRWTLPAYFCLVNLAALWALCRFLVGRRVELWEPQRESAVVPASPSVMEGRLL